MRQLYKIFIPGLTLFLLIVFGCSKDDTYKGVITENGITYVNGGQQMIYFYIDTNSEKFTITNEQAQQFGLLMSIGGFTMMPLKDKNVEIKCKKGTFDIIEVKVIKSDKAN